MKGAKGVARVESGWQASISAYFSIVRFGDETAYRKAERWCLRTRRLLGLPKSTNLFSREVAWIAKVTLWFSDAKYGGPAGAKQAAIAWREWARAQLPERKKRAA